MQLTGYSDLDIKSGPTREEIAAALADLARGKNVPLPFVTAGGETLDLLIVGCIPKGDDGPLLLEAVGTDGLIYDPTSKEGCFFEDI